jgi:hypothetical protein
MAIIGISYSHIDMRNLMRPLRRLQRSLDPHGRVVPRVARAGMAPSPIFPKVLVFSSSLCRLTIGFGAQATNQITMVSKPAKSASAAAVSQARRIAAPCAPRGWEP